MSYRELLLSDLCEGPVRFTDKHALGRRLELLQQLEAEGLITMRLVDVDEQESYLEVRLKEKEG